MAASPPATLAEFKARFSRDFKFGAGQDKVMDSDIDNAMADTTPLFNPALFDAATGKLAFMLATAHFVVTNVQAAGGLSPRSQGLGVENAPEEILSNKTVGGVSMSMVEPPEFVLKNTALRQFWSTDYGRKYLSLVEPRIRGAFGAVSGRSEADTGYGTTPNVPFAEGS